MSADLCSNIIDRLTLEGLALEWYRGKKVLITGGAGFIGAWLVETLTLLGSEVYVVDNLWRGSLENLKKDSESYWIPLTERFQYGDLREYHVALSACIRAQPDIVFHLADVVAGVDYAFANEPFIYRSNILINSNVYSAIQEAGVNQLIYLGTACSYPQGIQQKPGGKPLLEEQAYPADPESSYGWSKLMGEYEAGLIGDHPETRVGILRLHNVYGPKSILSVKRSQVIPSLIRKAIRYPDEDFIVWGSGKQARDFVFVGDVIDAILRTPLQGMDQGPIQIGTAKETNIAQLAHKIVEISGKNIEIKFDADKPEGDGGRSGNHDKARSVLGWEVTTSLEEGLTCTYDWARETIMAGRANLEE